MSLKLAEIIVMLLFESINGNFSFIFSNLKKVSNMYKSQQQMINQNQSEKAKGADDEEFEEDDEKDDEGVSEWNLSMNL